MKRIITIGRELGRRLSEKLHVGPITGSISVLL